ncbi:unnamed protein product [Gongylonema pulchrum]|uniref:Uncharacterized protein n=1 Tax=Gongylonema pulchrum TaxID=637853 RepID=A0A3P6QFG3_9BILA|nr:unnamed protein product [Gongylonema pulchrum]
MVSVSFIGWYRECGIILYTNDIDFAFFIEEYYKTLESDLLNCPLLKLKRRLNKPENLLEYQTMINGYSMDIFFLYHNKRGSWVGGLGGRDKYMWSYPTVINRICAADLLGYLMYVPCSPLDVIKSDYGAEWKRPISKVPWEQPHNRRYVGRYRVGEMKDANVIFG